MHIKIIKVVDNKCNFTILKNEVSLFLNIDFSAVKVGIKRKTKSVDDRISKFDLLKKKSHNNSLGYCLFY